jgi:hypothetical protein
MKNKLRSSSLLATATAGLLSQSASAAVIYNEGVDGDLDALSHTTLTAGLGTVQGSLLDTGGDFSDRAYFNGLTVGSNVRITFTTSDFSGSSNLQFQVNNNSTSGAGGSVFINESFLPASGPVSFTQDAVVGASAELAFYLSFVEGGNVGSYEVTVATVPEPSTTALTALAALSLLGVRRRKQVK